jgi:hypothetical protein
LWGAALAGGTLRAALVLHGSQPTATKAAQLTTLPHPDPTTTEESRAYLNALGRAPDGPGTHQAVFVGEAVCARKQFHASSATLSGQLRMWVPHLSALDAATLVDDVDHNLCPVIK